LGAGVLEWLAPHPPELPARVLAIARLVASTTGGCPFCVDMNASFAGSGGLSPAELTRLLDGDWKGLGEGEQVAAELAQALSSTPVSVPSDLVERLQSHFTDRERVILVHAIAVVNYWTRFNQGLGVPAAGFCDRADRKG
jgi:alkylhydroperoxidase family enzyme